MSSDVLGEIQAQVRELRASGRVPEGLEDELDACFEKVAEEALEASSSSAGPLVGSRWRGPGREGASAFANRAVAHARRRFGPSLGRIERRAVFEAGRLGEAAVVRAHVCADQFDRVSSGSTLISRAVSLVAQRDGPISSGGRAVLEGPLLDWVLEHWSGDTAEGSSPNPHVVLHAECGDGAIIKMLEARGLEARGADPHWSVRTGGDTNIVAAGALEYLSAAQHDTFDGILLTGVVDRLRPGAARVLAQLVARCLVPGGVVVLVSKRPEAAASMDPVVADLMPGRPLHPVTWCHLLSRVGLSELSVYESDVVEPEVFAVSAKRAASSFFGKDRRPR